MQQRYRTVEFLLRHFVARCGEVHRSQLSQSMLMFLRHAARGPKIRTIARRFTLVTSPSIPAPGGAQRYRKRECPLQSLASHRRFGQV